MRKPNLAMCILQNVREGPLKHAWQAAAKTRSMFAQFVAAAAGLHADQLHLFVL